MALDDIMLSEADRLRIVSGQRATSSTRQVERRDFWELIYDDLRDRIVRGDLTPGQRLAEAWLAEQYKSSTGPVRTALMNLDKAGLVILRQRRGAEVVTLYGEDVAEIYQVIEALEVAAIEIAATRMTTELSNDLSARLEALAASVDAADPLVPIDADLAFHRGICEASGNARLLLLWDQISEQKRLALAFGIRNDPSRAGEPILHQPMLAALTTRNAVKAIRAVGSHYLEASEAMVKLFPVRPAVTSPAEGEL
jgi:DNA-binding GntR family transcriptional regulator